MQASVAPTLAAAQARIAALRPDDYALTRCLYARHAAQPCADVAGQLFGACAQGALAREPVAWDSAPRPVGVGCGRVEPAVLALPPDALGTQPPDAAAVAGRDVWLVHPWSLCALPHRLPAETLVLGIFVADFHRAWPWSARRWAFVGARMAELTAQRWHGDAAAIGHALQGARSVRCVDEPHLPPWLPRWALCEPQPALFMPVDRCCNSFSQWWSRVTRGHDTAAALLAASQQPAC